MGDLTTLALVRAACGITTKFISDADGNAIIDQMEANVRKYLDAEFVPTTDINILDGDGSNEIRTFNRPITRLKEVIVDKTYVIPSGVYVYKETGKIRLSANAQTSVFTSTYPKLIKVTYDYAWMEKDRDIAQGESNADVISGSNVVVSGTLSGVSANQYVRLFGREGSDEICKVTNFVSGAGGSLTVNETTVDRVYVNHNAGSLMEKMRVPKAVERYATVASGLAFVARTVGQSFDELTSVSIGELQYSLGEPYTQFRQTSIELRKELDDLKKSLRQQASVW